MKEGIFLKRLNTSMTTGPLLPNIILYTVPIILTSILQLLFNAADLIIVGRFCGSVSVAAVGATGSITNLMVNFFVGLSVGAGVTVAHALGSREDTVVHNTVHTALPTALVSGVILTIVGVSFSGTFLHMMGTPDTVLPLSSLYMQIYFGGVTFTMVYNFCAAILRAAGDTRSPLIYLSIAGIVNVALNVVFVTIFHMNVAGVALATTISQGISAVLVVRALMKRTDACRLEWRKLKIYPLDLWKIARIGLPAGIQGSLFSISNVMIQSSINGFGKIALAGNTAAGNIEGFVYVAMNAFHQTAMNFMGQNTGARKYENFSKILWICLLSVGGVGILLGGGCYLFADSLLSIYITDSAQAVAYGVTRMSFVCVLYFLCGLMDVMSGMLRGMGSSLLPMAVTVLGVCGMRLGWIYTIFQIPRFHTPQCLYISYPVSWIVTFLFQIAAFFLVYRKQKQE